MPDLALRELAIEVREGAGLQQDIKPSDLPSGRFALDRPAGKFGWRFTSVFRCRYKSNRDSRSSTVTL
jgi:hypothetical protein